jgi:hypothetical protein
MIEPQNTLFPLPAESRPPVEGKGDSSGFGEMLAQSLAACVQVNPAAIQAIATGSQQQEGMAEQETAADPETGEMQVVAGAPSIAGRGAGLPLVAVPVLPARIQPPAIAGDGEQARPDPSPVTPTLPDPTQEVTAEQPLPGVATLPQIETNVASGEVPRQVPVPAAADSAISSADTASPPLQDSQQSGVLAAEQPDAVPVAEPVRGGVDRLIPMPVERPAPDLSPRPVEDTPVEAAPVGVPDLAEPIVVDPSMVPTPDAKRPVRTVPEHPNSLAEQVASTLSGDVPRYLLNTERQPVRTDVTGTQHLRLEGSQPVSVNDTRPAAIEPAVAHAPADSVSGLAAPAANNESALGATPGSPPGAAAQASSLADRVMKAVDLQRSQPPPRSMVVDIPEVEGLRLVVSVRSASHVTVAPVAGNADAAFAPFAEDLSRVLAQRGFVMNGEDRRGSRNQYGDDEPAPPPMQRGIYRRRVHRDNDLRI